MTGSGTDLESDHVVLAFGGSAGSVQPLIEIIGDLPDDLPAPVLVTIHVGSRPGCRRSCPGPGPCRQAMVATARNSNAAGSTSLRQGVISLCVTGTPS